MPLKFLILVHGFGVYGLFPRSFGHPVPRYSIFFSLYRYLGKYVKLYLHRRGPSSHKIRKGNLGCLAVARTNPSHSFLHQSKQADDDPPPGGVRCRATPWGCGVRLLVQWGEGHVCTSEEREIHDPRPQRSKPVKFQIKLELVLAVAVWIETPQRPTVESRRRDFGT